MMSSSRPMYEFSDDFALACVNDLPDVKKFVVDQIVIDGFEIRRRLDALREERENAKA